MIGVIADDFTGATDVAVAFRQAGLRVVVIFDRTQVQRPPRADAVVVALKTRTVEAGIAVEQSLGALDWLQHAGATQIFFKYCSTFDSRPQGNIGPVADALTDALGTRGAVFVPASPRHARTQYMGHLFVAGQLLSSSPMRDHPLTPMTESHLPTVLAEQTDRPVELIDHTVVSAGPDRVAERLAVARRQGTYVLLDAIDDADLRTIGAVCVDHPVVTGAAGLAAGIGVAYARRHGICAVADEDADLVGDAANGAVLAGSCSARTLEQLEVLRRRNHPHLQLDAVTTPDEEALAQRALQWYDEQDPRSGPLIFASLPPAQLRRAQAALGADHSAAIVDGAMGLIARGLVDRGVGRLVVAGGETSGAVVRALRVADGSIGREAAPGVPWIHLHGDRPLAILLKSGNFGDPMLLADAVMGAR